MRLQMLRRLFRGKFQRDVSIVLGGTAGAQLIGASVSPVITRLYTPDQFGMLGVFVGLLAVLGPMANLSYPLAIVLAPTYGEARRLASLSVRVTAVFCSIIFLALLLSKNLIAEFAGVGAIADVLWLLPIAVFGASLLAIYSQQVARSGMFPLKARASIAQAVATSGAKVLGGVVSPSGLMLIAIATCSAFVHSVLLAYGMRRRADERQRPNVSLSVRYLIWKYKEFPLFRTPQIVLNGFSLNLPVFMLASLSSASAAGFYSVSRMVVALPSALIGQSVAAVFYPRISAANRNGENMYLLLRRATIGLAVVGIVPFSALVAMGPFATKLVFGAEWAESGFYVQWMAIWIYFAFLNRPSVAAIPVLGLERWFLGYEVASLTARGGALLLGLVVFNSDLIAVVVFSVVGAALNLFLVAFSLSRAAAMRPEAVRARVASDD